VSQITIAICTHNRVGMLGYAIDSLGQLSDAVGNWEVLVVDNGSTDETSQYLEAISRAWPCGKLRVIREPTVGLSRARNTALRASESELVAFIDDDTVVSHNWLGAVKECFAGHPDAALVGGPIHLRWLNGQPAWMRTELHHYFSGLDYGPADCRLAFPRYPYGANYCVRREAALRAGAFPPHLGYTGQSLVGGEEIELARQLELSGWEVWYAAHAEVEHLICGQRTSLDWIIKRVYSGGITTTLLRRRQLRGVECVRQLVDDLRWLRYAMLQRRAEGTDGEVRFWQAMGLIRGWWAKC
jgi:glucosyl-dolichyl phosphate glucuronosyltransferase